MNRGKRPCAAPGCGALVESGYCATHAATLRQHYEERRGSSAQRGYDGAWRRFRKYFLADPENVVCADCKRKPSAEVHHVKKIAEFPELRLEPNNCVALCKACHSARTLRGE